MDPGSSIEVPVLFKPSDLGAGEHTADVSFTSQEVGEIPTEIPTELQVVLS